jgi:two-component system, NtrC family, response regulator AtoC
VAEERFREDLYYRLNVILITLPPLRDRREDLPLLVEHFLDQLSVEMNRRIEGVSAEGMQLLMAHDWPGNVRELRNVLERAAVVATGTILEPRDLGLAVSPPAADAALGSLEEVERRHIADVLRRTSGNVSQAARILDIDRATLYNKMKKYQFRRTDE